MYFYVIHFYLINKKSKEKILKLFALYNIVIDRFYYRVSKYNKIQLWSTGQQLVSQNISDFNSDIKNRKRLIRKFNSVFI
jgi:hypothetical protein